MHVRLVPYTDIFVDVMMDLDETTSVVDALELAAKHAPADVRKVVDTFRTELEGALQKARLLQEKRNG